MIDISDGLSVDLGHICEESGVGAEVDLSRVPLSKALRRFRKDPLTAALNGGEDFELLFAVRPRNVPHVIRLVPRFALTEIGRITAGKQIVAIGTSGSKKTLKPRGYEHFR
jgi:thiamine-monophosphate kinase